MDGQRGKEMRRRHSGESARFSEIRGMYGRVMHSQHARAAAHTDEALRNDIAGDRRGTAAHKATSHKGGR
jgi:hypothetical protein